MYLNLKDIILLLHPAIAIFFVFPLTVLRYSYFWFRVLRGRDRF